MVDGDWTITRSNSNIRYTGDDHGGTLPSYATVLQFKRWLGAFADDAVSSGDDEHDITDGSSSDRKTDNFIQLLSSYNIDAGAAEHLFDGSITQGTGGSEAFFDGFVNFGNVGVVLQIAQDGAILADDFWNYNVGGADDTSTDAAFMTDTGASFTTNEFVGHIIKNTTDLSIALITANTSTTVTGTLFGGTENDWDSGDNYLISQGLNADAAQGISHRFLIPTRTSGTDIDDRKLIGTCRTFNRTYAEFKINGTSRGNNVFAVKDGDDINNNTSEGTIAAYTDVFVDRTASSTTVDGVNATGQAILNVVDGGQFLAGDFIMTGVASDASEYQIASISTNALTLNRDLEVATSGGETVYDQSYGFQQIDVDVDTSDEDYAYGTFTKGAKDINPFTERMKWLSRDGSTEFICGLEGELFRGITHEVVVNTATGTFAPCEGVSWTGGTGHMMAINSPTAGTIMWLQLLTGVAPSGTLTITGAISSATVDTNTTVTGRESLLKTPWFGQTTGTALIGSYGFTLIASDLANTDSVTDLTNTAIAPPINTTFDIFGAIDGQDQIIATENDGGDIDFDQLTLLTNLTTANITEVVCTGAIPTDTPAAGTIRVQDNNGRNRQLAYTSYASATFSGITGVVSGEEDFDVVAATNPKNVFISYFDAASANPNNFTGVFASGRTIFVRMRDGGGTPIKDAESTGVWGSAGGSVTLNRVSDA